MHTLVVPLIVYVHLPLPTVIISYPNCCCAYNNSKPCSERSSEWEKQCLVNNSRNVDDQRVSYSCGTSGTINLFTNKFESSTDRNIISFQSDLLNLVRNENDRIFRHKLSKLDCFFFFYFPFTKNSILDLSCTYKYSDAD